MKNLLVICLIISIQQNFIDCFSPRIAYGDLAQPGQFPYHVLFKIDDDYGYNWCGGVLISEKFILTTTDCLEIGNPRKAYIGITNITDGTSSPNVVRVSIDPTNDFIFSPNHGKLALVHIKENVNFSDFIKPALLPNASLTQNELENKIAVLTGFGVPLSRHADTSKYLRYIEIPIIEQKNCQIAYPNFFDDSYLCASSIDGKSFCFGDQGGPLVIKNSNNENIVVGIAYAQSWCGDDKFPGAYVRLSSYTEWIRHVTNI